MAERVGRGVPGGALVERARRLPAAVWFVLLVAGALLVAIVVAVVRHDSDPLRAEVTSVPLQSDPARFTFSYDLTKNPLSIATCTFEVQDDQHDVVTTTTQRVGSTAGNAHTTSHTVTVATARQGVTAILDSCRLQRS